MNNLNEPEFIKRIWEETEKALAEEREIALCNTENYWRNQFLRANEANWDQDLVARMLALLYEGVIEWTGMMEEDELLILFFLEFASACLVHIDEETGEFESALYILRHSDDGIVVFADTGDGIITAGTEEHQAICLNLPFADRVHELTRKLFNAARDLGVLNTFQSKTGETIYVLFDNE